MINTPLELIRAVGAQSTFSRHHPASLVCQMLDNSRHLTDPFSADFDKQKQSGKNSLAGNKA